MSDQSLRDVSDDNEARSVPAAWRPVFREIVRAFVAGDYALSRHVRNVRRIERKTADQIRRYVASYGGTLIELPDESWESSVAQRMGAYWDVLIDLWTTQEGRSDLVLAARVFEAEDDFEIEIHSVHVP